MTLWGGGKKVIKYNFSIVTHAIPPRNYSFIFATDTRACSFTAKKKTYPCLENYSTFFPKKSSPS